MSQLLTSCYYYIFLVMTYVISWIVEIARKFINDIGGFEKFAEWGLY